MHGPFIPIAVGYVAGILLGSVFPIPWLWLWGAAVLALGASLGSTRLRCGLLWTAVLLAGGTNLVLHTSPLSPRDLRRVVGDRVQLAALRGRLLATPTQRLSVRRDEESRRTLAVVDATALRAGDEWVPVSGLVAVTTPGELPGGYFGGRTVEVYGVLRPPRGRVAEGLFDYRAFLRWQGVHYELVSGGTNDWQRVATPREPLRPPLADRFLAWAQRILARGLPEEDESLRLLWAMTLGWKAALTNEVSDPFMRTGTMHIFAISGLHIVLIAGILVALLRVLQVPRGTCGWAVVPLIWCYTAATGWQPSAIRSTLMMSVVVVGWALRRPSDLLNSLAAAAFIILVWDPGQLFQASFQLSFFVVLAIALMASPLAQLQHAWLAPDPFLPAELVPRWRRWLGAPLRWLVASVATSLAAWLGSLPLVAHYFHLLTPGSLLANLVIVPLSSLALMSNLGSLVCGDWLPRFTEWFNHSAWFWMRCMVRICEWVAAWPGACYHVRSPGGVAFLAYYALLIGAMTGGLARWRTRGWRVAVPLLVLLGNALGQGWSRQHAVTITLLGLRSGSAQFVDAPGTRNDLLIDCGDEPSAEAVVKPFLRAQGVNRLPRLLLTHGDVRHVGGAQQILATFRTRQTTTSTVPFRSPGYRRLLELLGKTPERWERVRPGDRVAEWTILHPPAGQRHPQADDDALVLRGEFWGTRVLLLSDLGYLGQAALLGAGADLEADIVVASLPARGEPLTEELLAAIDPRVIVLQDTEYPAKERAGEALRARLGARGVPLLCTSEDGTVTVRVQARRWEVQAMNGRSYAAGFERGDFFAAAFRGFDLAAVRGFPLAPALAD